MKNLSSFLPPGATDRQLIRAAAENHLSWFRANALAADGSLHQAPGVIWTIAGIEATIAFPRLQPDTASETLDGIIHTCRERQLERIACWSLSPPQPRDLGVRLAARGFEWGWRPHWMALDLSLPLPSPPLPDGVTIAVNDGWDWQAEGLPYYNPHFTTVFANLSKSEPCRTWHFVARQNGAVVGHSLLHVNSEPGGVGGIYHVGVVPEARHQGIGSTVSHAACQLAQTLGCSYVLLNSAADGLYTTLGFRSLGYGQTWWMHTPALRAAPPTPEQIAFAEAVGRGDTQALEALPPSALPDDLNAPLLNGMTPMEHAVRAKSRTAGAWLTARGATLDILEAWDLYGKARARQLLRANPDLVNRPIGDWHLTPLHEAVQRDDIALARFLLEAKADTSLQDSQFNGTPLGWARHLNRGEIAALLQPLQI